MSHHLDSPLARQDTRLDITDVFLFRGTTGTVFVMNLNSSVAGQRYPERFHAEALCEFKVDADGELAPELAQRKRLWKSCEGKVAVRRRQWLGRRLFRVESTFRRVPI